MKNDYSIYNLRIIILVFLITGSILNINGQKIIISDPPDDVEFCLPDTRASVSFHVGASGVSSYQWQAYDPRLRAWQNLSDIKGSILGSKTATLTIYKPLLGWSTGNSADLRVILSPLIGTDLIAGCSLIINSPATITADPVGNTVWIGESHTFSGSASGKPTPTYQWQRYFRLEWMNLLGATSSTYTTSTAGTYRLRVTNSCATDYSTSALLTMVGITSQPANVTICSGYDLAVNFTVGASGATAYQWQILDGKLWINIKDATAATLTITPPLKGFSTSNSAQFKCVVTFPLGTQTSNSAYFTVNARPTINVQPVSQTKNVGESVTFNVSASSTLPRTYQWYKDNVAIDGATATSITIDNLEISDAGGYKCIVTNDCGSATSSTATLTVVELSWPQGWFSQKENTWPENAKHMYDVHAVSKNIAWIPVTEYYDSLLHTNDGGKTWIWSHTGVTNKTYWRTIFFTDANHGWVGGYNVIAYTTNGGTSWSQWYSSEANYIEDLYFINSTTGWAVGYNGKIYKTTDGGVSWNPQTTGKTANFSQVHFADANNGIAVGQSGTIVYTSNGGTSWLTPTTNPAEVTLNAVYMTHTDTAFIAGSYQAGQPYPYYYMHMKTTDGGATWTKINGPANYGYDLKFVSSKEGWMASGSGKIYYTNDAGQHWYEQLTETTQTLYAISMVDADNGWAVGLAGAMQRTAFGGCRLPRVSLYEDQALCASSNYLLRADTFSVLNPTYLWSTGATTGSIYATSPGGKYWVDVWNVCKDKATDTIRVTFYPLPTVYAGEDTAICYGDTIQLSASGGISYSWNHGTYLSDANIPNPLASPPVGITSFTVTVTDENECSSSDDVLVTVYQIPTSVFNAPAEACEGLTELIAYYGNASLAAHFVWNFKDGNVSPLGSENYNVSWDTAGIREISLAVDENGCSSDTTKISVEVNSIPVSEFSIQSTVCGNDTVQIVYQGSGSAEASYEWNFDGGTIISGSIEGPYLVSWATEGIKTVSLQVTKTGCVSDLNGKEIFVSYPYEGEEICLVSVDLETGKNMVIWEKTEGAGIASYNIYRESATAEVYDLIGNSPFDDLSVFVDITSQPEVKSHKYRISVVDTCGNESALSPYHKTMLLWSNVGTNSINLDWSEYVVEGGGFGFVKYLIYRGDASDNLSLIDSIASDNVGYPDYNPPDGRMYYRIAGVKATKCYPSVSNGKKAGTGPYSHSMSNIEDNRLQVGISDLQENANNLRIYPNPFRHQTRISYNLDKPSDVRIEIYNLLGARTAEISNLKQNPGEFSYDLNAADLGVTEGIFYLRFTVNGNTTVKKLILTK